MAKMPDEDQRLTIMAANPYSQYDRGLHFDLLPQLSECSTMNGELMKVSWHSQANDDLL